MRVPKRFVVATLVVLTAAIPGRVSADSKPTIKAGDITTVAGRFNSINQTGTMAARRLRMPSVTGIAFDRQNRALYISDASAQIFRMEVPRGGDPGNLKVEWFAGTGVPGFAGDGHRPRDARFANIGQMAVDPETGDLYVADMNNYRIRAIRRNGGQVETVVGRGLSGTPNDRVPVLPTALAGIAAGGFSGDGKAPADAELNLPAGVVVDTTGALIISDSGNSRIRLANTTARSVTIATVKVAPGTIETIAGNGQMESVGDGEVALEASFAFPKQLTLDDDGNLYVAEFFSHQIRRIDRSTGIVTSLSDATTLPRPGITAVSALWTPRSALGGLAYAPRTDEIVYSDLRRFAIYATNADDHGVRRRAGTAQQRLLAGIGTISRSIYDGEPVDYIPIAPGPLALGDQGELFFYDMFLEIVYVVRDGVLHHLAGRPPTAEPRKATSVLMPPVHDVAVQRNGDVLLATSDYGAVWRVHGGVLTLFAGMERGTGTPVLAPVGRATKTVVPPDGGSDFFIVDAPSAVVRRIFRRGDKLEAEIFAGDGDYGEQGDGGPARLASFAAPIALARHPETHEVYIASLGVPTIRKVTRRGDVYHVAGTGEEGFGGDGGDARLAQFDWPVALAFHPTDGRLFIADFFNNRVRVIYPDGTIDTFAGNGQRAFAGDGGPAKDAALSNPNGVMVDAAGNILIADTNNNVIRAVGSDPPNIIETLIGTGARGFAGDGGPAAKAQLNSPRAIAIGKDGTAYIADSLNGRVRRVELRWQK